MGAARRPARCRGGIFWGAAGKCGTSAQVRRRQVLAADGDARGRFLADRGR